eukprot:10431102-Alexandrium_andersonii.AAC.1
MAVGGDQLPPRITLARPSRREVVQKYGYLLEARLSAAQKHVDEGGGLFGLQWTGIATGDW